MKKFGFVAALAATVAVSGCATYPQSGYNNQQGYYDSYGQWHPSNGYGYNNGSGYNNNGQLGRAATGAAVGAVGGAVAGAIIPGVSVGTGAIAGAVLGGVLGAVVNNRQYYRDTRGYCYYVDQYGQPHYDYNTRC